MAVSHNNNLNKLFLFLTFSLVTATATATATETTTKTAAVSHNLNRLTIRDLNAAIFTLRSNGYNLFANAIAVSDLSFQILTDKNDTENDNNKTKDGEDEVVVGRSGYTLLAPPNSALFSLDMSTDAFTYVNSLRFHVIMRRLSYSELRRVAKSGEPYVETLAGSQITAVARNGGGLEVDGVLIAFPNMYLRPNIAVHGLDGILVSSATRVDDLGFVAAPQPFAGAFSPEIAPQMPEIRVQTPEIGAPSPEFIVPAPDIGAPSPVTSFGSFTIGNSFDSVSVPPTEYFSSELAETPTPTPSPSPASSLPECSEWSDCEIEEFLSPYNWPTKESIMPTGRTSPTSPSPESSLWTSRKLAVPVEKLDEESRGYGLGWGVDKTDTNRNRNHNHDYDEDDVNFGRNNDNDEDDEFLLPPELNWW